LFEGEKYIKSHQYGSSPEIGHW